MIADPQVNALAWRVERACLSAWPALDQMQIGDWLVRFSEGLTRRANSACPRQAKLHGIQESIQVCKSLYRARGLPAIFRVPSFIQPNVDSSLEGLGYSSEGETLTLYADLSATSAVRDPDVELLPHASGEWIAAMADQQGYSNEKSAIYSRIVASITQPAAFSALRMKGQIIALAYGVVHDGLVCLNSVTTDARQRGKGYGHRICTTLISWAASHGINGVCLPVEADNMPGQALYRSVGLKSELYRYHYRREPPGHH
jgi:N-acetylglutamate synthase